MQALDIISVTLWQLVISLCNLLILFLLFKKFLYKPVRKMVAAREAAINEQYNAAAKAEEEARADKAAWAAKLQGAGAEAEQIIRNAEVSAERRGDKIVADAKDKAEIMLRQAKNEAELERRKAEDGIKREIVEVSTRLTEKMLEREIRKDDHKKLIDSFIQEIGENNDGDR